MQKFPFMDLFDISLCPSQNRNVAEDTLATFWVFLERRIKGITTLTFLSSFLPIIFLLELQKNHPKKYFGVRALPPKMALGFTEIFPPLFGGTFFSTKKIQMESQNPSRGVLRPFNTLSFYSLFCRLTVIFEGDVMGKGKGKLFKQIKAIPWWVWKIM